MNLVTIERVADDGLSGTSWEFWVNGHGDTPAIHLEECFEWTRPSRRSKKTPTPMRHYERFKRGPGWLPPLPDDVVAEAREKHCDGWQHNAHVRAWWRGARIVGPMNDDARRIFDLDFCAREP